MVGGLWRVGRTGPRRAGAVWCDEVRRGIERGARALATQRYWRRRYWKRRGVEGRDGEGEQDCPPIVLDNRLGPPKGEATSTLDVFRTRLWWDHLPSPAIRARGGAESDKCNLCGSGSIGTTWHVLAECGAEGLVKARGKGTMAVEELLDKLQCADALRRTWQRRLTTAPGGQWVWEGTDAGEAIRAGESEVPWFGVFGTRWLEEWMGDQAAAASADEWDKGIRVVRGVRDACVAACKGVWDAACEVWLAKGEGTPDKEAPALTEEEAGKEREAAKNDRSSLRRVELKAAEAWACRLEEEVKVGGRVYGLERAAPEWRKWGPSHLLDWYRDVRAASWRRAERQVWGDKPRERKRGKRRRGKQNRGLGHRKRKIALEQDAGEKGGQLGIRGWLEGVQEPSSCRPRNGRASWRGGDSGTSEGGRNRLGDGSVPGGGSVAELAPSRRDRPPE